MNELQTTLVRAIQAFVATSPLNRLRDIDASSMFEEPLVGFADGNDPLFDLCKSVVAPEHAMPRELLAAAAPGRGEAAASQAVGVVSWILPISAATRRSNRQMVEGPSLRWNHTRFQGEEFNDGLRRHVVDLLVGLGHVAVAPALGPGFRYARGPHGIASTWSERHAAYAAGLGTFGLSDGLITARGIAHRCGSVVVNAGWPATPRPYGTYQAYCLHVQDGSCGTCIERCPAGAIGPAGHDKQRCREYLFEGLAEWTTRPGYTGHYVACGLCQTGVPCEAGIPQRVAP